MLIIHDLKQHCLQHGVKFIFMNRDWPTNLLQRMDRNINDLIPLRTEVFADVSMQN